MRMNPVKRAIADGGRSFGTMVFEFDTPGIGRFAAGAGAEFVIYDMEHTGWSIQTIRELVATTRSADIVPLVRVPATEYHLLSRPLDVGAMGLMVPMVESVEQARVIAASAKYPPVGRRGAAFGVAHDDYMPGEVGAKMQAARTRTLVMPILETPEGVAAADAIAAVDGVDVLFLGNFDLTSFMGIPGRFDDPRYLQAVDTVAAAARRHGKSAGFVAADEATGHRYRALGYDMLAYGIDFQLYQRALAAGIASLRGAARNP